MLFHVAGLGSSLLGGETMPKQWEGSQRPITVGTEVSPVETPFCVAVVLRTAFVVAQTAVGEA